MSISSLEEDVLTHRSIRQPRALYEATVERRAFPRRENLSPAKVAGLHHDKLQAHEALYAEFTPLVRRLIRQYGQDAELRQDLIGEIYCRFCALLNAYDPDRGVPLRPYMVRQLSAAVYTYARQQWRIKRRETTWENDGGIAEMAPTTDPIPALISSLALHQILEALPLAMIKLPARQRKVIIWRYYEERSFEEIAQSLNIQPATARSLLRHGLNNLRKQMRSVDYDA